MIRKQFTMYLQNKPGQLAAAITRLANAKINIEGISVAASPDVGLVQIVPSNAREARRVLTEAKVPFTTQDVVLGKLKNTPGALGKVLVRMAKLGINVNYIYATASDCGKNCICYAIVSAPDLKAVDKVWDEVAG